MKKSLLVLPALIFIGSVFLFAQAVPPSSDIKVKKTGDTKSAVNIEPFQTFCQNRR